MAYEQDARQMLISRLRNVYEQEGEGMTGGAGGCPVGYKPACRNVKTGKVMKDRNRRNYMARVRYHMKKGLTKSQAEARASKAAPKRKAPKRKVIRTKKATGKHPAYGKPCRDFPGATAKRTGCKPAPKRRLRGDLSLIQARALRREDPSLTWNDARKLAVQQIYGKGLRYNPNYGGPGHMDGGVMMDSNYGGVLVDHFYD